MRAEVVKATVDCVYALHGWSARCEPGSYLIFLCDLHERIYLNSYVFIGYQHFLTYVREHFSVEVVFILSKSSLDDEIGLTTFEVH